MITYRLARAVLRIGLNAFFRRIHIEGIERIPARGPVLIVSNHTNAFVDPLLLLTRLERPVILTAKRTLAANPLLRPLIVALRVVLLSRRQDGGGDTRRNLHALDGLVNALREGGAVYIFPEGESHSDPGLRPFHTGAARIVLEHAARAAAEHAADDLVIVPVGLHFEKKDRWRSDAVAVVGEPWRAWDLIAAGAATDSASDAKTDAAADATAGAAIDAATETTAIAAVLTAVMRQAVERLSLTFRSDDERRVILEALPLIEGNRDGAPPLHGDTGTPPARRLDLVRRLKDGIAALEHTDPGRLRRLEADAEGLRRDLAAAGISPRELWLNVHAGRAALFVVRELEILLIGAPLALWGWINALPAYAATRTLVRRMSRDEDHWASNAVFVSIPVFGAWTVALLAAVLILVPAPWSVFWAASIPLAFAVALHWHDRAGGIIRRVRTFLRFVRHPAEQRALQARVDAFIDELRSLEVETVARVRDEARPAVFR